MITSCTIEEERAPTVLGPLRCVIRGAVHPGWQHMGNPPMPVEVQIRHARREEAAALSELCAQSKAVWGYDPAFMALARAALEVKPEEIAAGDVWVAEADGSVVGVAALAQGDDPETLDLAKLFVMPGWFRSGIGRALFAHAVAVARRRGARRLTILADPNAAGFYEANGAVRIGDAPSDAIPGRRLPLYDMACLDCGDPAILSS